MKVIRITQYGLSVKAGGWDTYGDSLTDKGFGCFGNKLTAQGCALTKGAQEALGATKLCWLQVKFSNGIVHVRQFQDRAPEDEERLDEYNPEAFIKDQPDYAEVSIIDSPSE